MQGPTSRGPVWSTRLGAGALFLAAAAFWLLAVLPLHGPLILADEYVYWARGLWLDHQPALDALQPGLPKVGGRLFLRLVNLVHQLGAFEATLHVINLACFLGAVAVLAHLALQRPGPRPWGLVALIAALPLGSYAAYVMPESLYFLLFAGLFATLARSPAPLSGRAWSAAGATCGAMALVKAHAVFALAALLAAAILWIVLAERRPLRTAAQAGLIIGASFTTILLVGGLLLGPWGVAGGGVVGAFYLDVVRRAVPSAARLASAASLALAQVAALLALLAPTVTLLLAGLAAIQPTDRRSAEGPDRHGLLALFLLLFWAIVILVACYLLAGDNFRLQLRYLDFSLPCALVLGWRWSTDRPNLAGARFRRIAAAVWALAGALLLALLPRLEPSAPDAPELFFRYPGDGAAIFSLRAFTPLFVGGCIGAGAAALWLTRWRWFHIQWVILAALEVASLANTLEWQATWSRAQAPRRAIGVAAAKLCGGEPSAILALGPQTHEIELMTAMGQLPGPVRWREQADTQAQAQLRSGRGCVISPHDLSALAGAPRAETADLRLYGLNTPWRVVWSDRFNAEPRFVRLGPGWSSPEPAGRWTDGPSAVVTAPPDEGAAPGPRVLQLDALAFTPPGSHGQRVEVSAAGRRLASWLVTDGLYFVTLPQTGQSVDLTLSLPDARSPAASLPGAQDRRRLGVAVRSLTLLRPAP